MENCDILKKSLLKKSTIPVIKKAKRVTFCHTVKVFIDELNCDPKNIAIKNNCVEISIVDKSSNETVSCTDISKNDDCNATEFLVHKVIYENSGDDDDVDTDALSEDADESSVLFESNADDEGLHFVVHKVTDHEDDLLQQELELESKDMNVDEMKCNSEIVEKLSNLSIENILTHDKIIAFIDRNTIGLSSLLKSHLNSSEADTLSLKNPNKDNINTPISSLKCSELVLSPPLQELSLDEIVKAQSGNALCELDISPLNSIQETDSDSDASSEGTMIMMTTEESEKNEQHIRESFQKYESIKKEKVQIKNASHFEQEKTVQETSDCSNSLAGISDKESHISKLCFSIEADSKQKEPITSVIESFRNKTEDRSECTKAMNYSLTHSIQTPVCDRDFNLLHVQETRKTPFTQVNNVQNSYYWDKSLESVQIPEDVREWKILLSDSDKNSKSDIVSGCQSLNSCASYDDEYLPLKSNMQSSDMCEMQKTSPKSDELESFVLASKERVQRIRKRYLENAEIRTRSSPVRGIRPRFGSTAEIVQLMQKQNQHPFYTLSNRSHVSWPCNDVISNSEINIQNRRQSSHIFSCHNSTCEYSFQSPFSSNVSEDSCSSTCEYNDSVSSCPSIFFQERGIPEGASPPQSFSEDNVEQYNDEENTNNIVYFSMKV